MVANKRKFDPRAVERGLRIAKARKELHLSQQEVAERISTTREAVAMWERGAVGMIEHHNRVALCKVLGMEERELLLDPSSEPEQFDMTISREAKAIAYRWDDLPEAVRLKLKHEIAETYRLLRETPEYAKRIWPELEENPAAMPPKDPIPKRNGRR